ncbi:hypothetical protein FRB98_005724 [Tulasnella sp. 332]|nr:hypothetical protein FRB98_005724 [Tulasnella sp. 332]
MSDDASITPITRIASGRNASTSTLTIPLSGISDRDFVYGRAFELLDDGRLIEPTTGLFERKLSLRPFATVEKPKAHSPHPSFHSDKQSISTHPFVQQTSTRPSRSPKRSTAASDSRKKSPANIVKGNMPKAPSDRISRNFSSESCAASISIHSSRSTSNGRSASSTSSKRALRTSRATTDVLKDLKGASPETPEDAIGEQIPMTKAASISIQAPGDTNLPLYSYRDPEFATAAGVEGSRVKPARVHVTSSEEVEEMISCLQGPLGFDMEWKPQMVRGRKENKTALIQLADNNMILLIQVSNMKVFPPSLQTLIEDSAVIKTGVNIRGDRGKLERDFSIQLRGIVELDSLARQVDEANVQLAKSARGKMTLQSMVNMYCARSLDKGTVRMSDWGLSPLSEPQMDYAANDAHSGLVVYNRLMAFALENEKEVELAAITDEPYLVKATAGNKKAMVTPEVVEGAESSTTVPPGEASAEKSGETTSVAEAAAVATDSASSFCPAGVRPYQYRAYSLWHDSGLSLDTMCGQLRTPENPLAKSTVISYVVETLKGDRSLPFSQTRLVELAQMEHRTWLYHRKWIESLDV